MTKKFLKTRGAACQVTFELPKETNARKAVIVGEFSDWDPQKNPMKRTRDGRFRATLRLDAGKAYRFRYWLDDTRWVNDPTPDQLVPNPFGSFDSVVVTA